MAPERRYRWLLASLLAAGFAVRVAYVVAEPAAGPLFSRPVLDGAYYLDWAKAILSGTGGPGGAYYMAPLYPFLLAGFLKLFGESFALLYLLQHACVVASAGLLAAVARRAVGDRAALACAACVLAYHPLMFFASRPLGEPVSLLFLALAFLPSDGSKARPAAFAGAALGAASLGRPNLLLVALLWAGLDASRRRFPRALALLAGTAVVLLPVAVRNLAVSGHLVPVSANSGVVFYLGNHPDSYGVLSTTPGFTGNLASQRDEAVALARSRSGRDLDPVEADRWLGREALRMRLGDIPGTVALFGRKIGLTLANAEQGLDDLPRMDANPLRFAAPLPFALLLGLAAAGLAASRLAGTGGGRLWCAVAACAAAPVLFYVSSRHRLPLSLLLAVPAGAGFSALLEGWSRDRRRCVRAAVALAAGVAVSFAVPTAALQAAEETSALCSRAAAFFAVSNFAGAEKAAREALEREPRLARARFILGAAVESAGRTAEAELEYRKALDADPAHAGAAANLAAILVRKGRPGEAVPILKRAIETNPGNELCWRNLVVALATAGEGAGARETAASAARAGVRLDPGLLRRIGAAGSAGR